MATVVCLACGALVLAYGPRPVVTVDDKDGGWLLEPEPHWAGIWRLTADGKTAVRATPHDVLTRGGRRYRTHACDGRQGDMFGGVA